MDLLLSGNGEGRCWRKAGNFARTKCQTSRFHDAASVMDITKNRRRGIHVISQGWGSPPLDRSHDMASMETLAAFLGWCTLIKGC